MSHIAEYGSYLNGVDRDLFMQALMTVAESEGVPLAQDIDSYDEGDNVSSWEDQELLCAIRTKDLPQGLGVYLQVDDAGKLKPVFVADKLWLAETTTGLNRDDVRFSALEKASENGMQRLQAAVEKTYVALAYAVAMAKLGYKVQSTASEGAYIMRGTKEVAR